MWSMTKMDFQCLMDVVSVIGSQKTFWTLFLSPVFNRLVDHGSGQPVS